MRSRGGRGRSTRRTNLLRQYGDAVPDPFVDYLELEELAAQADIYASQVIPGILQTHHYAHAVIEGSRRWRTEREVKTFAELRMQRAAVLTREAPLPVRPVGDGRPARPDRSEPAVPPSTCGASVRPLVPHQATFALLTTSRSRTSGACLFCQTM
ncbi:Scr1 family TA system antitoxin-like transcriptional regulator [Streptomyces sp. CB02959]|uniref:Scr1 family TA system antitoxin-like transcriptional regulator n=1 Tax=Streptomyces sp. CB02959 TaxID=2020330 RepID=UPI0011AFBFE2|nr:Scr1 family TA system antitoxin-like transcriptional regulator [Streptomyces sp. CB02959]